MASAACWFTCMHGTARSKRLIFLLHSSVHVPSLLFSLFFGCGRYDDCSGPVGYCPSISCISGNIYFEGYVFMFVVFMTFAYLNVRFITDARRMARHSQPLPGMHHGRERPARRWSSPLDDALPTPPHLPRYASCTCRLADEYDGPDAVCQQRRGREHTIACGAQVAHCRD